MGSSHPIWLEIIPQAHWEGKKHPNNNNKKDRVFCSPSLKVWKEWHCIVHMNICLFKDF